MKNMSKLLMCIEAAFIGLLLFLYFNTNDYIFLKLTPIFLLAIIVESSSKSSEKLKGWIHILADIAAIIALTTVIILK